MLVHLSVSPSWATLPASVSLRAFDDRYTLPISRVGSALSQRDFLRIKRVFLRWRHRYFNHHHRLRIVLRVLGTASVFQRQVRTPASFSFYSLIILPVVSSFAATASSIVGNVPT